jgi:putative restriction endonuclease
MLDFGLILESREGSGYADSERSYEFPSNYLARFDRLDGVTDCLALLYEPRREGGRQAFVAWTTLRERPEEVGAAMYRIRFLHDLVSFDTPVPLQVDGLATEHRLREVPRERWGSALRGRAVRPIPVRNIWEILAASSLENFTQLADHSHTLVVPTSPNAQEVSRVSSLVNRIRRHAAFRDVALKHFSHRCAVTGWQAPEWKASRLSGLLEAAHVRPLAHHGADQVENALVLTPTVHRMFDAGFIGLQPKRGKISLRLSPALPREMHVSAVGEASLALEDGAELSLPDAVAASLDRDALAYHMKVIFQGAA